MVLKIDHFAADAYRDCGSEPLTSPSGQNGGSRPRERSRMVDEARLEQTEAGLEPVTDGWFVVNVRDVMWYRNERCGSGCWFEGREAPFAELGINIRVLPPGQANGLYHAEATQEDFLVLDGECLLLVE